MSDQQTKPDLLENLSLMIRDCNESLKDEGSGYTEDQRQSVTLLRDVARLAEAALTELARIGSTARANGPIMCSHCREVVAGDMDDPELETHMMACERHPMRAVEARVKALEAAIAQVLTLLRNRGDSETSWKEVTMRASDSDEAIRLLEEVTRE